MSSPAYIVDSYFSFFKSHKRFLLEEVEACIQPTKYISSIISLSRTENISPVYGIYNGSSTVVSNSFIKPTLMLYKLSGGRKVIDLYK